MRKTFILALILGLSLLGCSSARRFLWLTGNSENSTAEEPQLVTPEAEAPVYLTPEERLDDVISFYNQALDSTQAKRNIAAQNLFEAAIVKIADLEAESLGVSQDDLDDLYGDLISDYAKFLDQLPVLPAESSPSAVYLSLSEFLGDTVASMEDLIDRVLPSEDTRALVDSNIRLYPPIPLVVNSYVEEALVFFQTKARKVFSRWLERSEEAVPYFAPLLREEGMPEELVYLAMIESGFSNIAYSRAAASGPWQFIASTGRIYGLEVGKYYDERRDPELATHAACRYLRKLYNQFNDWYLAFAAYNCGEMNVDRAIKRTGSWDYWVVRPYLPRQTRDYVPYYLAARLICQDPAKYGFELPQFKAPQPTGLVYVNGNMDLKVIAKCADTDHEILKALNPALKKGCTPPNAKNFPVRVPANAGQNFSEKLSQVPRSERQVQSEGSSRPEKSDWVRHRVRSGETLSSIAQKYGVRTQDIANIPSNRIKNPHKLSAGHYLLIPVRKDYTPSSEEPVVGTPQPLQVTSADGAHRSIYSVRRGDSIGKIAQKYRVSISDIKTWNHLWGEKVIYPGQKLILWTKSANRSTASDQVFTLDEGRSEPVAEAEANIYVIRRGDTLWDIAKRFGLSVQDLKKWNGIRSAYRLKPGEELKLKP